GRNAHLRPRGHAGPLLGDGTLGGAAVGERAGGAGYRVHGPAGRGSGRMNLGALALTAALGLGSGHAIPQSHARVGSAMAEVHGSEAVLSDGQIRQSWHIGPRGRVTVSQVTDRVTGRDWNQAGAPEFSLQLDSAPTSSLTGWRLIGATAQPIPPAPARPAAGRGVEIAFRYGLATRRGLLELDRTWTLYSGSGVEGVSSQLVNRTPLAARVGQYSLAQLTSAASVSGTVLAFHGGSDWRQDFRSST